MLLELLLFVGVVLIGIAVVVVLALGLAAQLLAKLASGSKRSDPRRGFEVKANTGEGSRAAGDDPVLPEE